MKAIFTLVFSILCFCAWAQAPVNDDCLGIIDLGVVPFCSNPGEYTNVNATESNIDPLFNIPACFAGAPDRDVWFQFTIPADGSANDVQITVSGDINGNGTMHMPQAALYRGDDCSFGNLAEIDCGSAVINENVVSIVQIGLTAGATYYLRVNDYSATAAPNWGTFRLCIQRYVPDVNMGAETFSESCIGGVWDSGGPSNDYMTNENLQFTICPQDFHQCIILNVEALATERGYDALTIFAGANITSPVITTLSGNVNNLEIQVPGNCATLQFISDNFAVESGFHIKWTCSPDACVTPAHATCANPDVINSLPYTQNNLSNCFSDNSLSSGPCSNDNFFGGNDYVFAYTSPGDMCISITTSGTDDGAGLGLYNLCPDDPGATCIATTGGNGAADPGFQAVFLSDPGTYYIVFGAGSYCSQFNIKVDTVTCPLVLPPASTCDHALNIGGCSNVLPEEIKLTPGAGDPNFIVNGGPNAGCFTFPQFNYSFFYFKAGADGKFGFVVQSADPINEPSDIDINVWGPIDSYDQICDYVTTQAPARSTWTGGQVPTGLADIHPGPGVNTGTIETDDYDCGTTPGPGGDNFVRRLDVVQGKIYVVMMDDYSNAIINSGISINFGGTDDGVLLSAESLISVSNDTVVCPGQPVQLNATGGVVYAWNPDSTLSCGNCPNPIATVNHSTKFQVSIGTACNTFVREVNVKAYEVNLGSDAVVCTGASFTLNPHPFPGVQYDWIGSSGLSCTDCPSPVVSGLPPGVYTYIAILTAPTCVKSDTIRVTVLNGTQPQYNLGNNDDICLGETVSLGGDSIPGTFYAWSSHPSGYTATIANPKAAPAQSTTYYLTASNGSCPVSALDSVVIGVFLPAPLAVRADTAICDGQQVRLGNTKFTPGNTYNWSWIPNTGIVSDPNIPDPVVSPETSTVYTLTAKNPGCTVSDQVTVAVVKLDLALSVPDSNLLCRGSLLPIKATIFPDTLAVNWSSPLGLSGLQLSDMGRTAIASPIQNTTYNITTSLPGCIRKETIYIQVDSLPHDLSISPSDTTICIGNRVLLVSPIYDPGEYQFTVEWFPKVGLLKPDYAFNMLTSAPDTTHYYRVSRVGACIDTARATINVVKPPTLMITPPLSTVCAGVQVPLLLGPASSLTGVTEIMWSPSGSLSCSSNCINPTATPQASTTYTVSGKYSVCQVSASAQVNVVNPPTFLFPIDTNLCVNESIKLNGFTVPGTSYTWTSTDPNFGTVTDPQPTTVPNLPVTTYFVKANNGCPSEGKVTVVVTSATLDATGDATICKGGSAVLGAITSLPNPILHWSSGQNGQPITVSPNQTTTYQVEYTFGDNCKLTDQVIVAVQGENAALNFPDDTELCPGESITLNSASTAGATYDWTSNPAGFTSKDSLPTVTPSQTTTYYVTRKFGICTEKDSVKVIVYQATLNIDPDNLTICAGEDVALKANVNATGTFLWTTGSTDPMIKIDSLTATKNYGVTFVYGGPMASCTLTDAVSVTVNPSFNLSLKVKPDTTTFGLGDPIDLMAIIAPSQPLAGFQYAWSENNNPITGTSEKITVTPNPKFPSDTTTSVPVTYKVVVTSPNGCTRTVEKIVNITQPIVRFPNVFTPNGDGVNDEFTLVSLRGASKIESMEIYNRWGKKVYESSEPNAVWDGKSGGTEAPSDVYVYIIKWRDGSGALHKSDKGQVTLLR
ncbi:MAG: gliding motility-associated C-terminal domain-containing protein [Bacteroidota bacterium]